MKFSEQPSDSPLSAATPICFAQERLWVLEQLSPGRPIYHLSAAFRLAGQLDPRALEQSFGEMVKRHELLRTRFMVQNGQPAAVVLQSEAPMVPQVDLSGLPPNRRDAEVRRLAVEQDQQPFDVAHQMLLRATLVRLDKAEHVLLLTFHRLAADAESIDPFVRELLSIYDAVVQHQPLPPKKPGAYGDFAAKLRDWLSTPPAQAQLAFWKEQLQDLPSLLELPMGLPRPPIANFRTNRHAFKLNMRPEAAKPAKLSTILLAAFAALLSRYSGRKNIPIGVPSSYRVSGDHEGVLGNFENLVVLRTDLSGDPSSPELLRRISASLSQAQAHAQFPFEKLVEELKSPRDRSYNPIVQVRFILRESSVPAPQSTHLAVSRLEIDFERSEFDLTLEIVQTGDGLEGWFEYATDLFKPEAIARMAGHLTNLVKAVCQSPDQPLSRLPLLTQPEQRQLLEEWNQTADSSSENETLASLFERQAQRTPEAIALVFGQERLTYRELDERAALLARHLREAGVGPEVVAGICAQRGPSLLTGILGILKAGGAYIPLDPAYPAERLAFILQAAKADVLLTQAGLSDRLPPVRAKKVFLDDPALQQNTAATPFTEGPRAEARNLAYVIYTSGSTGQPKGVAIEHRSAVNFVRWAQSVFTPEELAGVLASTSVCFDLSIFEMFVPLTMGGKIILADNALELPRLPSSAEVTLINTVPSAMAELVRAKAIPESVKVINLAGEALGTELVAQIYGETTVPKVFDLYGPTETTVYSTYALRSPDGPATIGRPIANTQIYLLDENQQLVPPGLPGELYIGGAGLARGYFHQPELTAEKFVPNPFDPKAASRLYRTGDLARFRPDGSLEFLGRKDSQVKIRGFRIELGEVETVLRQHSMLAAAAVVVREDGRREKQLVAYVVPKPDALQVSGNADGAFETEFFKNEFLPGVRAWLRSKLPDYMVPGILLPLTALPLTPNGKVDRKALPSPEQLRPASPESFIAPRSTTETMLAEIWCEVLGLQRVGVHDNFFELGGHSLRSIQIISRLRESVQVEVAMRDFFEHPTIADLAEVIESALVRELSELSEEEAATLAGTANFSQAQ